MSKTQKTALILGVFVIASALTIINLKIQQTNANISELVKAIAAECHFRSTTQ